MKTRPFEPDDRAAWDAFVATHGQATLFHGLEWKAVIEKAFGHRTHYLLAEDQGRLRGVLPLGRIRSRLFGDTLVSVPFAVYGGILAEDPAAHAALESAALELAERLNVGHLELRNRVQSHEGWPHNDLYVTFRKDIDPDPEVNLKSIPRRQRAMVRQGIKNGLTSRIDENVDVFFALYAESVRNLGTPVFPRRYFELLRATYGERCEVLTVLSEGRPVTSVLSFYYRDEVVPYYAGGTAAARDLAAHDFMYWELMRRACERGIRVFDYGRSKRETGSYRFKKHWGFEPQPLFYECHLVRSRELPQVNPLNPKYGLMIRVWKRLPLPLANVLGPMISRNLG